MKEQVGSFLAVSPGLAVALVVALSCAEGSNRQLEETVDQEDHHDEATESLLEISSEKVAAMRLVTAFAERRTLPGRLETTGQVDFDHDQLAHVSPRIPGRVHEVRAVLGATVRRGEILAVLDSIELGRAKADYLQAQAREQLARQNLDREEELFTDRISSEKEMMVSRAAHVEAEAELRNAFETLHLYGLSDQEIAGVTYDNPGRSLFAVRAPLAGKVVEKHVTIGELVTPERNLLVIANLEQVWIWIDVFERDLSQVHLEDDVEVRVDAYPEVRFEGRVSYLSPQVDVDTRRVRARIDVGNLDGRLRPGMFARVILTDPHSSPTIGSGDQVLTVPESAVQRIGEAAIVFVALAEDQFEARSVGLGRRAGGVVEILEGLSTTDRVVVKGTFFLKSELSKDELGEGDEH